MLIAYLWIRQTWHDAYLKWNKEDYDGLEVIRIPSSLVWRPDLVLYNKYARTSHKHVCIAIIGSTLGTFISQSLTLNTTLSTVFLNFII